MQLSSIPELVRELAAGHLIVLVDDEDRENEGDLIAAAQLITPEMINFMARYARGLICLTLTPERCTRLGLKMQVREGDSSYGTNFTVPIEAASGVTTGISVADRAHTIRMAVSPDAKPDDLVQPGHVFPIRAQPGGVLERAGHTEAGSDLCRLAGLEPASVLVEIMNEDGTMARRADLEAFSKQHGLKMGSIADLIRYRSATERMVSLCERKDVKTAAGPCRLHLYVDDIGGEQHLAFVFGTPGEEPVLVRVHQYEPLHDLARVVQFPGRWSFTKALNYIADAGTGVLVLLGGRSDPAALSPSAASAGKGGRASTGTRTLGIGSQILSDIGVKKIRLLGSPTRYPSLSGFDLQVVDFVPAEDAAASRD